jgi:hypothetical protein
MSAQGVKPAAHQPSGGPLGAPGQDPSRPPAHTCPHGRCTGPCTLGRIAAAPIPWIEMRVTMLDPRERTALLDELERMPTFLRATLGSLTPAQAALPGSDGTFSPVEHAWHLADLERDGYALRIRRLLAEERPHLVDFDGARIARERQYRSLSLAEGLAAFAAARGENLAALRRISGDAWNRAGTQDGVGAVSLCDVPAMMAAHDGDHRQELEQWIAGTKLLGEER